MAVPSLTPYIPPSLPLCFPSFPFSLLLFHHYLLSLSLSLSLSLQLLRPFGFSSSIMKFINISSKNLSPKRLFRSKKDRYAVSSSDPPSFGSGTDFSSSFSSSSDSIHKPGAGGVTTPTSVLAERSGYWSEFSADLQLDMAKAFKLIDRDNDGVVSRKELEALLCQLGNNPPSQEEVTLMLSEVDRDGSGSITLEALLNQVGPVSGPPADSELRDAFEVFDTDNDGKISAEELLRVFKAIGDELCTLEECRRMIAEVDKNGDGFVCFEEFVHMMELQR
ncbi:probable calcium-binding protein CML36 [Pyrus communis]